MARCASGLMIGGALLAGPVLAAVSAADSVGTPAQWHDQKVEFTYTGFTAYYTCDGLENKVRLILLTLGARKDAKVHAVACDRASNTPNKFIWVKAEFSTLAPAAEGTAPKDTVQAAWTPVQIAPNRPTDMGMGECELMDELRPVIEKGFALRNTAYTTNCVPKHISVGDYNLKTEALRMVAPIAN